MSRWNTVREMFVATTPVDVDDNAAFFEEWDRLREEAFTAQEREEIDAIFARHAA